MIEFGLFLLIGGFCLALVRVLVPDKARYFAYVYGVSSVIFGGIAFAPAQVAAGLVFIGYGSWNVSQTRERK